MTTNTGTTPKLTELSTATGYKTSAEYSALSPTSKSAVDTYMVQYDQLLAKRAALETEKRTLINQGNLSTAQTARLAEIDSELNKISSDVEALKSHTTDSLSTEDVARTAAKQELATQVIATVPPPPPGAYKIVHGIVQKGDIISYMKFTQHLNPYGRKRQCDTDLENLVAVINKDFNNQAGEYKEIVKEITYTVM